MNGQQIKGDNGTGKQVVSVMNGQQIKGDKGSPTTHGTHVPMIAYWDGVIKPGQLNDNLIDFTDFVPSLLAVAGSSVPEDFDTDGLSFHKQLLNKKTKVRDWVYCSYDPRWGPRKATTWAHDKRWKLFDDGRFYDMEKDPLESTPITDEKLTSQARKAKEKLAHALSQYKK